MARGHSLTPLALALVITAGAAATPATAQQPAPGAPGVPPSRYGWEYEIEVADRLYENGYLDAAEKDYTAILTAYGDNSAGVDLAWLGLAKVHQARGETARARASLGEVLRRDSIPGVDVEARDRYRALRAEAEMQLNEARRAVFYYEGRYRQTSWMNPFGKLFHYMDFRKSKKKYEEMVADLDKFDPRFLIEPVAKPSMHASADTGSDAIDAALASATAGDGTVSDQYRLTPEEMAALLQQAGGAAHDHAHDHASSSTGDGTVAAGATAGGTSAGDAAATGTTGDGTGAGGAAVVATAMSGGEALDLDTAQASYFSTYQELREALSSGDAARIQTATQSYQDAKAAYEQAKTASLH